MITIFTQDSDDELVDDINDILNESTAQVKKGWFVDTKTNLFHIVTPCDGGWFISKGVVNSKATSSSKPTSRVDGIKTSEEIESLIRKGELFPIVWTSGITLVKADEGADIVSKDGKTFFIVGDPSISFKDTGAIGKLIHGPSNGEPYKIKYSPYKDK